MCLILLILLIPLRRSIIPFFVLLTLCQMRQIFIPPLNSVERVDQGIIPKQITHFKMLSQRPGFLQRLDLEEEIHIMQKDFHCQLMGTDRHREQIQQRIS